MCNPEDRIASQGPRRIHVSAEARHAFGGALLRKNQRETVGQQDITTLIKELERTSNGQSFVRHIVASRKIRGTVRTKGRCDREVYRWIISLGDRTFDWVWNARYPTALMRDIVPVRDA
jgi:hypothetical protein